MTIMNVLDFQCAISILNSIDDWGGNQRSESRRRALPGERSPEIFVLSKITSHEGKPQTPKITPFKKQGSNRLRAFKPSRRY
jgi:hypothetical protein